MHTAGYLYSFLTWSHHPSFISVLFYNLCIIGQSVLLHVIAQTLIILVELAPVNIVWVFCLYNGTSVTCEWARRIMSEKYCKSYIANLKILWFYLTYLCIKSSLCRVVSFRMCLKIYIVSKVFIYLDPCILAFSFS